MIHNSNLYDLVIVGGGPAGVAAGIYASRKRLKTRFITESFGGQSVESMGIENWVGTIKISGIDFAKSLEAHLKAYSGDLFETEISRAEKISKSGDLFLTQTASGEYQSKTLLLTTGSKRRKLEIPGAKEFENKGITYCASCDGPLFADMDVAVIGGGNAGFETAAQLLAYAKTVTLLQHREEYKADPITVKKVLSHPKMRGLLSVEPILVEGDNFVKNLKYKNKKTGEEANLPVSGIFVEIGLIPSTDVVKNLVQLNSIGQIIVDPKNQKTSLEGVWAAGDCTDGLYHQNNIAAGDAVKALEDIYMYIHGK